ncbi:multidrug effflux MFS transporter [Sulfitobacter sabulilitoris]|uniref:Bcr/CflA family efflux transporter n=1 Tax=Sulfitobacter sabulilitoris TaxID=2562655 RepID=A0A5S3PBH4_9RHOB|nr:multidrug effflux MFS transporter [Sulfitobacter sabulilitoris]TMM50921.1 multidrug effflux MFS transporter [Sulfitobacter sabulilitoris]
MQKAPLVRFLDRATPPHIATLILLSGMSAMVMNMFLPSLPNMTEYFQTEYRLMQLSVALYLAVSAILQIVIGPISDNMGRRPVIMWGLGLFLLATLGCIYAPSAEVFLVFRMCQAVIAVAMVLSRAVVRDMFAQDRAASMIGYVTMGMAVVPMLSPALGGVLDELFGWKANFWALFLLAALTLWLTWADLGETAVSSGKTLRAQFAEYPELLTSPRFWGYSLAASFCSGAFFAYLGGAPFVGSVVFGMSPSELGLYFGAPAIGYFAGNFVTGRYATYFGINKLVLWGSLANSLGVLVSLIVFWAGYGSPVSFFGLMTLVGVGNGLVIPNATAGMLSVRPHLAGTASGLGGAIMIGGGAMLSALAGALLTPSTGAYPLLYIMLSTSTAGVGAIAVVYRRERRIGLRRAPE